MEANCILHAGGLNWQSHCAMCTRSSRGISAGAKRKSYRPCWCSCSTTRRERTSSPILGIFEEIKARVQGKAQQACLYLNVQCTRHTGARSSALSHTIMTFFGVLLSIFKMLDFCSDQEHLPAIMIIAIAGLFIKFWFYGDHTKWVRVLCLAIVYYFVPVYLVGFFCQPDNMKCEDGWCTRK
eukprot:1395925-Rhodomonas_salina.1